MQESVKDRNKGNKPLVLLLVLMLALSGAVSYLWFSGNLNFANQSKTFKNDSQDLSVITNAYVLSQLAADRIQYAGDYKTAAELLVTVQNRLAQINNPQLDIVRAKLKEDLEKLANINQSMDFAMKQQLVALDNLLDNLVASHNSSEPKQQNSKSASEPNSEKISEDKWQQTVQKIIKDVKSVVKVRKKSEVEFQLSGIDLEFKEAQLRLLLEQLRWAIYYRDSAVFQRSIQRAVHLVTQSYSQEGEDFKQFVQILKQLETQQLENVEISIQSTVDSLQALIVG